MKKVGAEINFNIQSPILIISVEFKTQDYLNHSTVTVLHVSVPQLKT